MTFASIIFSNDFNTRSHHRKMEEKQGRATVRPPRNQRLGKEPWSSKWRRGKKDLYAAKQIGDELYGWIAQEDIFTR
ncbi:hypothetical protein U1Q18_002988 [Sarracenia purpurea var. burkii]